MVADPSYAIVWQRKKLIGQYTEKPKGGTLTGDKRLIPYKVKKILPRVESAALIDFEAWNCGTLIPRGTTSPSGPRPANKTKVDMSEVKLSKKLRKSLISLFKKK